MAWNPLGDVIATGSNDKSIKLLRFNPDTCVQEGGESDIFIHNGTVRELAFVPDKTEILVSGGAGRSPSILENNKTKAKLPKFIKF